MIWFIIAAAIAVYVGFKVGNKEGLWVGLAAFIGSACFCGLVAFTLSGVIGELFIKNGPLPEERLESKIQLKAFSDHFGTGGAFFLGSGAIGDSTQYYFYAVKDDGSFYLSHVYTDKAVIKEENRQDGTMETWTRSRDWKLKFWGIDIGHHSSQIVFKVPIGTVKTNFNADLK